jgi:hypothetical protein
MAEIIHFPAANELDWRDIEQQLRKTYEDIPDGTATLEACLPTIKQYWEDIFVSFDVAVSSHIPGPLTDEQTVAIKTAADRGMKLVAERLRSERAKWFALIAGCEWRATYYHRKTVV